MRSRILAIQNGISKLLESRKLATKPPRCPPHMNELPVPCGPWDPWYRQRQSFYMKHFLFGLAWLLFSFGLTVYTESLYLNWGPPDFPGPPSDMIEECDDSDTEITTKRPVRVGMITVASNTTSQMRSSY